MEIDLQGNTLNNKD